MFLVVSSAFNLLRKKTPKVIAFRPTSASPLSNDKVDTSILSRKLNGCC